MTDREKLKALAAQPEYRATVGQLGMLIVRWAEANLPKAEALEWQDVRGVLVEGDLQTAADHGRLAKSESAHELLRHLAQAGPSASLQQVQLALMGLQALPQDG